MEAGETQSSWMRARALPVMGYDSEQVAHLPLWSLLNECAHLLMTPSTPVVPSEDPNVLLASLKLEPSNSMLPWGKLRHTGSLSLLGLTTANVPCAAAVEKTCRPRQPRVRRTSSLDTIVGSYLLGQWPRDAEGASASCMNDKATQDSPSGFLSPSPILRLSPCLHRSLEGLNQELEEVFVKEQGDEELLRILDVPDGHRAPAPAQRGSGAASLTLEPSSGSCSSLSLSPSPSVPLRLSPHTPVRLAAEEPSSAADGVQPDPKEKEEGSPSPVLAFASSPRPNHSYMFKREPPEGCEKVRAFEEASSPSPDQTFQPSCPDKNKVHFNPTGSAFCPVSLVKPLFPNVGFLFRGFPPPSSPGTGTFTSCQPTAPTPFLGVRKDAAVDSFSEVSKSPSLNYEHWKRGQPEESVVFHSSLVV
ncbi:protein FAM117A isoform 8-T8 [Spheniscus humboldti]